MWRVCILSLLLCLGLSAEASARDLTGIYLKTYSNQVEYFNLTDQRGSLTGYYQIVRFDANASDGLDRIQYSVTGSVDGGRAILNLSSGTYGSYQWTADVTWSGFLVSVPLSSGEIKQVTFTLSSVDEVNASVAQLTRVGTTSKYYLNVAQDLESSYTRLSDLSNARPQLVAELHQAQARVRAAMAKKKQLEQKVVDLQTIATQKHKDADAALAAATTPDETYQANQLEYDANSADYDVNSGKYNVSSAQYDLTSALDDMKQAQANITDSDREVVGLKARISSDKSILSHAH